MMSKAAYQHEYEQQRMAYYFRRLTEFKDTWLQDPWTNEFNELVQKIIEERPKDKKIILKAKDAVMRGVKE